MGCCSGKKAVLRPAWWSSGNPDFVWGSRQATCGCPANGWWPLLAAQRSAIDEVSVKELPDPRYFKAAGLVQRSVVEDIWSLLNRDRVSTLSKYTWFWGGENMSQHNKFVHLVKAEKLQSAHMSKSCLSHMDGVKTIVRPKCLCWTWINQQAWSPALLCKQFFHRVSYSGCISHFLCLNIQFISVLIL